MDDFSKPFRRFAMRVMNAQITNPAEHEGVGITMMFQIIEVTLTDVAEVACAEREAPQRYIDGQQMTTAESIEWMSKTNVVVGVS